MDRSWVTTSAEENLAEALEAEGIVLSRVHRQSVDLTLWGTDFGCPLCVQCLTPFSTGRDVDLAMPDPSVFRLDAGNHACAPRRWALWHTTATLPLVEGGPAALPCAVQALWSSEGLSLVVSVPSSDVAPCVVGQLGPRVLLQAYRATKGRNEKQGRLFAEDELHSDAAPREPTARHSRSWSSLPSVVANFLVMAGLSAGLVLHDLDLFAAAACVGVAGLAGTTPPWLRRLSRPAARSEDQILSELLDHLQSTGLFRQAELSWQQTSLSLPVVVQGVAGREPAVAPVSRTWVKASGTRHGVAIRLLRTQVQWPSGGLSQCCIVPHSWTVFELSAHDDVLRHLPDWSRTTRQRGTLSWLMNSEELNRGELWQRLQWLARLVQTRAGGPYR